MLKLLKREWTQLVKSKPGYRFSERNERHSLSTNPARPWKTVAIMVGALVLLVAGVLLSLAPGIPGFVLWIPALGILAARSKVLAAFFDRMELFLRRILRRILPRK